MSKKGTHNTYFRNVWEAIRTLAEGAKLTLKHIFESKEERGNSSVESDQYFEKHSGRVTLQYPKESLPVPDNGRYRLHNEIDDCIVCDKCAKVCPVNCIEIEPIRAVEEIGKTSDGTSKRIYAAKFDIDMGKCCFCGLCTTVCPTECLTMTKAYDFSVYDINEHNYGFAEMTPMEILLKKKELEEFNQAKAAAKKEKSLQEKSKPTLTKEKPVKKGRPTFKPKVKVASKAEAGEDIKKEAQRQALELMQEGKKVKEEEKPNKPVFRPKIKPSSSSDAEKGAEKE
ncbi:4Fe-4S binding protein, partial [Xanthovirga aplysinae]|uniref:4Fe-4S binding protein n=1 Tax=Xanthovirga aplysinae TaxID=2529853 RepID=UPI0012BCD0C2